MIGVWDGHSPLVEGSGFIAGSATVIGQITLGVDSSVWYGAVLRGDVEPISVGARTNIQDLCVLHGTGGRWSVTLGADVTVGHRAILHGCTIEDRVLVGMGAIVMDGAVVGEGTLIAAGSLVPPGTHVPAGSLWMGSPGKVVRQLRPEERAQILASAKRYVALANKHRNARY